MSKELKYVECPNCGEVFDDSDKFIEKKTFLNHHKFTCQNCDYSFKYPSNRPYFRNFLICLAISVVFGGLVSVIAENMSEDDLFMAITIPLVLGLIINAYMVEGLLGGISNKLLENKVPYNYKKRLHNTLNAN